MNALMGNPSVGDSWEAFVINQILATKKSSIDLYFYRTHQGTEIDVVLTKGIKTLACAEIKFSNSPKISRGNIQAFRDLRAPDNFIITPSSDTYLIKENIRVCSVRHFIVEILPDIS
jgi:hypothetical protein